MTRKFLLGSVAAGGLLVAALPASAADLRAVPAPAPVIAPVVPVFSWTGWYIGGNVGGKWGKFSGDVTAAPVTGFPATGGGDVFAFDTGFGGGHVVGGGQIGFNWQVNQFVFGVEGDLDATNVKRDFALGFAPGGGVFTTGDAFRFKNDWQGSVRGRGGIAFDRFLVYATGGVAWAGVTAEAFYAPGSVATPGAGGGTGIGPGTGAGIAVATPGAFASDRHTLVGATIGGGVEFALTDSVSLGVEYRYSDFGHETFNLGAVPFPAGASSGVVGDVDLRTHEVTARLNFKFGSLFGGLVPGL